MADEQNGPPNPPENKPPSPRTFAAKNNGNVDAASARRQRKKHYDKADTRRQVWMIVFTGVIAVATLVYTGVSARQLIAMNDQLGETKAEASSNADPIQRQLRKLNASVYEQEVAARAEAKAAAEEKLGATAARTAADTAYAAFQSQGIQFSEQLATIKQSVGQQNRFASASEKSAATSARELSDHEDEQRASVTLNGAVSYASSVVSVSAEALNFGATAARQVRVAFRFQVYPPGTTKSR